MKFDQDACKSLWYELNPRVVVPLAMFSYSSSLWPMKIGIHRSIVSTNGFTQSPSLQFKDSNNYLIHIILYRNMYTHFIFLLRLIVLRGLSLQDQFQAHKHHMNEQFFMICIVAFCRNRTYLIRVVSYFAPTSIQKMATGQWYAPSAVINDAWYWMVLHCIA